MDEVILKKLEAVFDEFKPRSMFVYGSHATGTTNSKSDYEVGVIFDSWNYTSRSVIKAFAASSRISIYPFKMNELLEYKIDTPFNKNIYIASLIGGGAKTIFGKRIIESLDMPKITKIDLISDTNFNLGLALSAFQVQKKGDFDLAASLLYKSAFFVARNLIYCARGNIVNGYNNIYKEFMNLWGRKPTLPNEIMQLLEMCYQLRNEMVKKPEEKFFFWNLTFINKFALDILERY